MRYVVKECKSPEELAKEKKGFSLDADLRKGIAGDFSWSYTYSTKVLEVVIPEAEKEGEKEKPADPVKEKLAAFGKVEVGADA